MAFVPWPGLRPLRELRGRRDGRRRRDSSSWPGCEVEVLFTPGHSPGHVTYAIRDEAALFTGDVLFQGSVGRVDLPGGDWPTLLESIRGAGRRLPRGDDRLSRSHGDHDARRRARHQPVPGRARALGCHDDASASRPRGGRSTSCPPSSRRGARDPRRARSSSSRAPATGGSRRPRSRTPTCSRAGSARAPTSSTRRCSPSPTRATAASPCARRRPRRSAAPTSSTACTGCRSR